MKFLKAKKLIVILFLLLGASQSGRAQGFVTWGTASGGTLTGTFTGGTVTVTQAGSGGNYTFISPTFDANATLPVTNLNNPTANQAFRTNGLRGTSAIKDLVFTFSKPVIINEISMADIDRDGDFNDSFSFIGLTFNSVTGALVNFTTTGATANGAGSSFTVGDEWARWTNSTTLITSFSIRSSFINNFTSAHLYYAMKVTACNSGTAAPTLSATTKKNTCPANKIDLTTITSSNQPSGTTITWHTGTPATTANLLATPSAVDPGTYHAAFFDSTSGCYSGLGTATTSVTATFESCCNAGNAAPTLSATTISNVCHSDKVNLTTLTASNKPANMSISWHTGTPATTANLVSTPTAVGAGIYYAAFFDSALNCYSGAVAGTATTAVNATVHPCVTVAIPNLVNTTTEKTVPGIAPLATTGTAPFEYTFSDGSADSACVAPTGFTSLTGAGGTVNNLSSTTGKHTVTTPEDPGSYFYCIKVCDENSCAISIHTVNVVAACPAGTIAPVAN